MTNAELVEKIRRICQDSESIPESEHAEAARLYATRLRHIDKCFRRAIGLLRADQLAETDRFMREERLIEDYESLTTPDFNTWQDYCRVFSFETPPELSEDAYDELKAFQEEFEAARELFARRRKLALENASFVLQLETLYDLELLLGERDVLTRQIKRLETARNDELVALFQTLDQKTALQFDFAAIDSEINNARRRVPVPAEVLAAFRKWNAYAQGQTELNVLRQLTGHWDSALAAKDVKTVLDCLAVYRATNFDHAARYITKEERRRLDEMVRATLDLERAEENAEAAREAIADFESALGDSASTIDDLRAARDRAEQAADAAGMKIPSKLESVYVAIISNEELQRRRKTTALVAAAVAALALIVGGVAFVVSKTTATRNAREAASMIAARLDAFEGGDADALAEVEALVAQNAEEHPAYQNAAEYAKVLERVADVKKAEEARVGKIKALVDNIQSSHDVSVPAPEVLADLKTLFRNEKEKTEYGYVKLLRDDARLTKERKESTSTLYEEKLAEAKALVEAATDVKGVDAAEWRRRFEAARSALLLIVQEEKSLGVSKPLVAQREALDKVLDGEEERLLRAEARSRLQPPLAANVGNVEGFVKVLTEMKNKPEELGEGDDDATKSALSSALQSAIESTAKAKLAQEWNESSKTKSSVNDAAFDLESYLKAEKAFHSVGKFAPEEQSASKAYDALKDFARNGGYDRASSSLVSAFDKYRNTAYVVYDSQNKVYYYATKNPKIALRNIEYYPAPERSVPKELPESAKAYASSATEAPQYAIYRLIDPLRQKNPTPQMWIDSIEGALRVLDSSDETVLDPIMKAQLLAPIIRSANGFPGFDKLAKWAEDDLAISGLNLSFNSYDVEDYGMERNRDAARKALQNLPSLAEAIAVARTAFMEGELSNIAGEYQWVGFVDVDEKKADVVFGKSASVSDKATLWICPGNEDYAVQIGDYATPNTAILNEERDWTQYRWSPVYARVPR